MTPEIRTELLKLSRPNVDNPDLTKWIENAKTLEAYVSGAGEPSKDVQPKAVTQVSQVRTPRKAS
jgi:hypothetical protein